MTEKRITLRDPARNTASIRKTDLIPLPTDGSIIEPDAAAGRHFPRTNWYSRAIPARKGGLAQAIADGMNVTLTAYFVADLIVQLELGDQDFAAWRTSTVHQGTIGKNSRVGLTDANGVEQTYWFGSRGDRNKYRAEIARRARWALGLGLTAEQALACVGSDADRAETLVLASEQLASARAWIARRDAQEAEGAAAYAAVKAKVDAAA